MRGSGGRIFPADRSPCKRCRGEERFYWGAGWHLRPPPPGRGSEIASRMKGRHQTGEKRRDSARLHSHKPARGPSHRNAPGTHRECTRKGALI